MDPTYDFCQLGVAAILEKIREIVEEKNVLTEMSAKVAKSTDKRNDTKNYKIEFRAGQTRVNLVDLEKYCTMNIAR